MPAKTLESPAITPEMVAEHIASIEPQAVEELASYWRMADMIPAYPADTETVSELLEANGYRCSRDSIIRMIDEKVITAPERLNGRLVWRAVNIKMLAVACEMRRRWQPLSRFHRHKMTQWEVVQAIAAEDGDPSCFSDLAFFDESALIAILHEPGLESLAARQALAAALADKLRLRGIDV